MLARMTRLADLTWPEARRCARNRRSVVLLPLGAVEQHGPHPDFDGIEVLRGT
jgi:creatinine amidohydrolase/Fe(II)-dependent formamide hydrolase-like protein